MNTPAIKLASPQALKIYSLLSRQSGQTAAEIGEQLCILPNAVYRAAEQLLALGVIKKTETYPTKFEIVANEAALAWYTLAARKSFLETFPAPLPIKATPHKNAPTITFIKDRVTLLGRTDKDVVQAQQTIDFIVSGLEVPDSTVLAYRRAARKGVRIRALLQHTHETSQHKLEHWQDLGADVRYTADTGIRLFVIDARITYFTSYNSQVKNQAFGVRFDHPPMATLMNELFEEKWNNAKLS